MPIVFYCPRGHRLKAPRRKVGQIVDCPVCRAAVIIPPESTTWTSPSEAMPPPLPGQGPELPVPADVVDSVLVEVVAEVAPAEERPRPAPPPLPGGASPEPVLAGPPPVQSPPSPAPLSLEVFETVVGEEIEAASAAAAPPPQAAEPTPSLQRIPPPPPPTARVRTRRTRWVTPEVVRPDRGQVRAAGWVAAYLLAATLFAALPALPQVKVETAMPWARAVLLVALIQAAYVAWFWSTPDWAAARVLALVFAVVTALYAAGAAIAYATPLDASLPLELGPHRFRAGHWCAAVLLLMALGAYLSGRLSVRWQQKESGKRRATGVSPVRTGS